MKRQGLTLDEAARAALLLEEKRCASAAQRAYYAANKEKIAARGKLRALEVSQDLPL